MAMTPSPQQASQFVRLDRLRLLTHTTKAPREVNLTFFAQDFLCDFVFPFIISRQIQSALVRCAAINFVRSNKTQIGLAAFIAVKFASFTR
jgi:hypothetical protein